MSSVTDMREVVLAASRRRLGRRVPARAVAGVVGPALAAVLARAAARLPDIDTHPVVYELVFSNHYLVVVAATGNAEPARAVQVHRAIAVGPAGTGTVSPAAVPEQVAGDVEVEACLADDRRAIALVEIVSRYQRAGV